MAAEAVVIVLAINLLPRSCTKLALRLCSSTCSPCKKKNWIAIPVVSALLLISSVGGLLVLPTGLPPTQRRRISKSGISARALARQPLWLLRQCTLWPLVQLFHAVVGLILPVHTFLKNQAPWRRLRSWQASGLHAISRHECFHRVNRTCGSA